MPTLPALTVATVFPDVVSVVMERQRYSNIQLCTSCHEYNYAETPYNALAIYLVYMEFNVRCGHDTRLLELYELNEILLVVMVFATNCENVIGLDYISPTISA